MYTVSSADHPRELSSVPQSSIGAPCPMLIAGEHTLRLAYYLEEGRLAPEWANATILPPAVNDSDELCAVVQFSGLYTHMSGPPNDEAFSGHPLASRGLSPYAVFEVEHSSWVRTLERMNSVHPYHRPERFATFKHYIFAFHDTTFECVAESFSVSLCRGSVWRVLQAAQNDA
jgi:hypothetical protein